MAMNIILSPQRRDDSLTLEKSGTVLTINGMQHDTANPSLDEWLVSVDGDTATVLFPNGPDATEAQRFPAMLEDVPDGPVELP